MNRLAGSLTVLLAACGGPDVAPDCPGAGTTLRIATTTSVDNTGLLEVLLPPFTARTGVEVHALAVGTGQALKLAQNGDVDAIIVHDQLSEEAFVDAGYGVNRRRLWHNDFVIVGPSDDPAGLGQAPSATDALALVMDARAPFVSRGDDSGTHKAERRLWAAADREPAGPWYVEAGQGMRLTLNMAHEKQAYCLVDRATFLDARDDVDLVVVHEGDERLLNVYSAIAVNPARHPDARYMEAMQFIGWVSGVEGQRIAADHSRDGHTLFHADAVP